MAERDIRIESFLRKNGWDDAHKTPIAGDMSSRQYFRLQRGSQTAILMLSDQPIDSFVVMTDWLAGLDLSSPRILASELEGELLILEDFGCTSIKQLLDAKPIWHEDVAEHIYTVLLTIRASENLDLSCPDARELVSWTNITDSYVEDGREGSLQLLRGRLERVLAEVLNHEPTVSLRDFHSENMMWLPHRNDHKRIGLLDYQDAFLTHPVYDLVSWLTDARTHIPDTTRVQSIRRYAERSGDNLMNLERAFAAFSVQRNLRIIGVFFRAKKKPSAMINTYNYLLEALAHPDFRDLRSDVIAALPTLQLTR
ncbi:MAG: phosphotransferase [Pseudomonadota bacterium]